MKSEIECRKVSGVRGLVGRAAGEGASVLSFFLTGIETGISASIHEAWDISGRQCRKSDAQALPRTGEHWRMLTEIALVKS